MAVATHMSSAGGRGDPNETPDMDWSHFPQASRQHYTTRLNEEYRREKKKRMTEWRMAPQSGRRRQRNWIDLETVGEIGSEPERLKESCCWPMPQKGRGRLCLIDWAWAHGRGDKWDWGHCFLPPAKARVKNTRHSVYIYMVGNWHWLCVNLGL